MTQREVADPCSPSVFAAEKHDFRTLARSRSARFRPDRAVNTTTHIFGGIERIWYTWTCPLRSRYLSQYGNGCYNDLRLVSMTTSLIWEAILP